MISESQVAQFHELGYFLTDPAFSDDLLAEVSTEFDRVWRDEMDSAERSGDADRITLLRLRPFIGAAHTLSPVLAEFVKEPIYLDACAKLIGPDADLYYNQIVIKPPEEGKHFGWHQDSGYTTTKPLSYITCWTAISRTFVENGCIWVIPGSHKWGLQPHHSTPEQSLDATVSDESGAIPIEMAPGQVAIFSSLTLHKSGPNVSGEVRKGYVPQYHVPGVVADPSNELMGDQYPVLRGGVRV